jgi:3-methyladenine DNA glycosylase AlkC
MEPFKNLLNPALVARAGALLREANRGFDARRFESLACSGLEALEMKARAMQIADALEATLPNDFARACDVLQAALAPAAQHERIGELGAGGQLEQGLEGWILWPVGEFIARRGLAEPGRALVALREMTQRFSAELAIRPFIAEHPALTFAHLHEWASHPNLHVRRLVSEGSRPRLPWALQLKALIADPSPSLPLLRALQDDASEYVRRSVANHLNDIAKDHPALVAAWLEEHLPGAGPGRQRLLRHASRTLIKQGDARVLAAWGLGAAFKGTAALSLKPRRLELGGAVVLTLELHSTARQAQALEADFAVHHVKADGSTSPKVFKGWKLKLGAGEAVTLTRRHPVVPITTRRYFSGRHRVVVQVNGQPVAESDFVLKVPGP